MSEQERFLARWSRRKHEAEKAEPQDTARAPKDIAAESSEASSADAIPAKREDARDAKPAFDVASLPSIESIGADTNIRAFLAEGVPAELKRAALRRVWTADPAIRDFKGLQENDWDFTKPESIPGFGELSPELDVQEMVRRVFGDPSPEDAREEQIASAMQERDDIPAQPDEQSQGDPASPSKTAQTGGSDDETEKLPPPNLAQPEKSSHESSAEAAPLVQRTRDDASQREKTPSYLSPEKPRRAHGGALPRDFRDSDTDP